MDSIGLFWSNLIKLIKKHANKQEFHKPGNQIHITLTKLCLGLREQSSQSKSISCQIEEKTGKQMVFCHPNCSDLLWKQNDSSM